MLGLPHWIANRARGICLLDVLLDRSLRLGTQMLGLPHWIADRARGICLLDLVLDRSMRHGLRMLGLPHWFPGPARGITMRLDSRSDGLCSDIGGGNRSRLLRFDLPRFGLVASRRRLFGFCRRGGHRGWNLARALGGIPRGGARRFGDGRSDRLCPLGRGCIGSDARRYRLGYRVRHGRNDRLGQPICVRRRNSPQFSQRIPGERLRPNRLQRLNGLTRLRGLERFLDLSRSLQRLATRLDSRLNRPRRLERHLCVSWSRLHRVNIQLHSDWIWFCGFEKRVCPGRHGPKPHPREAHCRLRCRCRRDLDFGLAQLRLRQLDFRRGRQRQCIHRARNQYSGIRGHANLARGLSRSIRLCNAHVGWRIEGRWASSGSVSNSAFGCRRRLPGRVTCRRAVAGCPGCTCTLRKVCGRVADLQHGRQTEGDRRRKQAALIFGHGLRS